MSDLIISDQERKKKYLKRYRKNCMLIERLKEKRDNLDGRITGLKSPGLSDMPRGGTPISKEDLIAEKLEVEARILRLDQKGKAYKDEILEKIDELDDPRHAEVLESFFIGCKEFGEIAEDNNYTVRHVIRLYSEAINRMSIDSL